MKKESHRKPAGARGEMREASGHTEIGSSTGRRNLARQGLRRFAGRGGIAALGYIRMLRILRALS